MYSFLKAFLVLMKLRIVIPV